ncbi:hypothetical protein [Ruficoccus sp. ZRK36]|uniref:hypothetical protein n=1 Tax=Ruficoccus sp. ZRK36 TaxID=2866311 RepID=UPI001C73DAF2|nr:hypothetical protein [Ruficoccus sp. ZRK36]QYY36710.1 hypothetical protein K0V07_04360 [Ruficoccus sp. ZRK36]
MLRLLLVGGLAGISVSSLEAAREHSEAFYQVRAATQLNGQTEVALPNDTRCDILTDTYAIEVDFADKWTEAIGQSLNYAAQTGRQAAIILVIEKPDQEKYLTRLQQVVQSFELPIRVIPIRLGNGINLCPKKPNAQTPSQPL